MDRSPVERAEAWLYTGPLGHLWSVSVDLLGFWSGWMLRRVHNRGP